MTEEDKLKIIQIKQNKPRISERSFELYYNELYLKILSETSFLNADHKHKRSLSERIFCILHDIHTLPLCDTCKKEYVAFVKKNRIGYYSNTCSITCANKNKANILKRQKSVQNFWKNSELKEQSLTQTKNNNLAKYGCEWPTQSAEVKDKTKSTCLKKYGQTSIFKNEEFKQRAKKTKEKHYGKNWKKVLGQLTSESLKNRSSEDKQKTIEKMKKTKLERYGDANYCNVEKMLKTRLNKKQDPTYQQNINLKTKETIKKHIDEDPNYRKKINDKIVNTKKELKLNDPEYQRRINDKVKNTLLEHYGVSKPSLTPNAIKAARLNSGKRSYERYILNSKYDIPLFSLEDYINRKNSHDKLNFKCKQCGNVFQTYHDNGVHSRCPKCFPIKSVSHQEKEIVEFLKSFNLKIEENNRKNINPYELDIYIPDKKLAIEFDGIFWHNSEHRPKNYHLTKTELCEKQGIQLIHVFENEWNLDKDIVKSRLRNLLGIYDKTIFARKCQIREVSNKDSVEFLDVNHIQHGINSNINVGLFYDNELISLMTFSKCRFDKKHEWELVRFCNKLGYHIPGAAGKLLKYFEKTYKPMSLVSYADRRWSQGKLYQALDFKLDHISAPNYWYFKDPYILESRIKYQKHKLKDILENFDENKTEFENMKMNGYHRIFDCGNLVFEKVYK